MDPASVFGALSEKDRESDRSQADRTASEELVLDTPTSNGLHLPEHHSTVRESENLDAPAFANQLLSTQDFSFVPNLSDNKLDDLSHDGVLSKEESEEEQKWSHPVLPPSGHNLGASLLQGTVVAKHFAS